MATVLPQIDDPLILSLAGLVTVFVAFVASGFLTRLGVLPDHPNGRSNHLTPISRAGGVAIIAAWLVGLVVAAVLLDEQSFSHDALKLAAVGGLAALVGFADDKFSLTPLWKIAGQFAAALVFVWIFGPLNHIPMPVVGEIDVGGFGVFLTVFWIVAFMNVFNFMDGANGLASVVGIFSLCALSGAAGISGAEFTAVSALLLALALIGFLPKNFPRAQIFMGDGGSQGVAFLIAALALLAADRSGGGVSALFIPTIVTAFIFDAAFTLAHRIIRRQNFLHAHREHLYQLLMRLGASHARVTALYLGLTALATTAAIFMLRLPPRDQWVVPVVLFAVFAAGGGTVFIRGKRQGLLATGCEEGVELTLSDTPISEPSVAPVGE